MSDSVTPQTADGHPREMRRGRIRRSVAAAAGVVAVGVVALAALVPLPDYSVQAASVTVSPAAGEQTIVCPGPLSRLSDASGANATRFSVIGTTTLVQGTNPSGVTVRTENLDMPDNTGAAPSIPARSLTSSAVLNDERVALAAAQASQVADGDTVGFAASACQSAALESWLVGGATTTGRTSFVYLVNPTDVAASVDLTVYAEQGAISSPGSRDIVVPAGAERVISLAGLAPNVTSPVVNVRSSGGHVAAWLQHSVVRGLNPGGAELTGSTSAAADKHVIPGVEIAGTTAIAELLGQTGNEDLQSILRVYPATNEATAMAVTFTSENIGVPDTTINLGATAGVVTDFVLRDVPDGTYTVTISADHPVYAAVRSSVVSGADIDVAWYQSGQELGESFVVVAPTGPSPRLHVYNPSGTEAVLEIATPQGDRATFTIPSRTAAGIPLGAPVYTATSTQPLVASVGYLESGAMSSFVLTPPGALDGAVTVFPN